ncbi:MAG: hypothetical protein IKU84_07420, partial [Clostridia bacterium]|nr:hypothetical protein [Clostridia bacterium]
FCCGARKNHRDFANPRFFRPLPLAQVVSSATGGTPIAPLKGKASIVPPKKAQSSPMRCINTSHRRT